MRRERKMRLKNLKKSGNGFALLCLSGIISKTKEHVCLCNALKTFGCLTVSSS